MASCGMQDAVNLETQINSVVIEQNTKLKKRKEKTMFDSHQKERQQIELLEQKILDFDARARWKALNLAEQDIYDELKRTVREMKKELPGPVLSMSGQRSFHSSNLSGFRSHGEELQAIITAGRPGGVIDPRLHNIQAAASGLGESVPSEGGFLLSQDFSNQVLMLSHDISPVAGLCNRISISSGSNSIKLPAVDETSRIDGSRWGGITSYWLDEGGLKIPSKPKFRAMELILKKVIGAAYITDELLQDANALETVVRQGFAEELAFRVDSAIISGTGAGQPLGILNSGAVVQVDKESGQKAKTIVFENIVKMWSRMLGRSRKTAVWLVNQDIESQLYTMSLAVGTGGSPVFLPGGQASSTPYATLFGRPLIPIEQCETLGTAGDIILADLSSYILIDKGGLQSDVSIHVRFLNDESTLRFVFRCDGQPMYAAAVTPFKGSETKSPFVILQTRA